MKYELSPLITLSVLTAALLAISIGPFTLFVAAVNIGIWFYFLIVRAAMKKIEVRWQVSPQRVFTDEAVECVTTVVNPSRVNLENVHLVDFGAENGYTMENLDLKDKLEMEERGLGEKGVTGALKAKGTLSFKYAMGFRTRGEHKFLSVKVTQRGLFGLFSVERIFFPQRSVLVFPKILPIERFKTMLVDPIEGERADFRLLEDASHIVGVHEYNGEPFQRIHWKVSAHLDKLMVKEYEYTASSIVRMYVDYNLPREVYARKVWSSIRKDYEEYASIAASGVVKYFSEHGMQITLKVLADKVYEVRPQWTRKDYVPYLDALARASGTNEPSDELLIDNVLKEDMYSMSQNTTVVIFSLYLTDTVIPELLTVKGRVARLIAFVMPYGFRMPYHKKYRSFAILPQEIKKLKDQSTVLMENNVMVHVMMDNESIDEVIRSYERNPLEYR